MGLWCREEYFGLRVRHKLNRDRAINVPVNCTVGPSGVLQAELSSSRVHV
jgi:hypothetical protein